MVASTHHGVGAAANEPQPAVFKQGQPAKRCWQPPRRVARSPLAAQRARVTSLSTSPLCRLRRSMLPTPVTSGGSATPRTPSGAPGAKALPAKGSSLPSSTKLPGRPVGRQPAVASPATSFGSTCGSSLSFAPITPLPQGSGGGTAEVAVEQEVEQQLDTAVAKGPCAEAASKSQAVQDVAALQDDFSQVRHLVQVHGSASAFNAIIADHHPTCW